MLQLAGSTTAVFQFYDATWWMLILTGFTFLIAFISIFVGVGFVPAVHVAQTCNWLQARMQKLGVREMVGSYFLMDLDWQKEPSLFKRCKAVGSCAELTTDAYARVLKHFFVPMNVMSVPAFGFLTLFYTSPDTSLSTDSGIAAISKNDKLDCQSIMAFGSLGV